LTVEINLLPEKDAKDKKSLYTFIAIGSVAIIVLIGMIIMGSSLQSKNMELENKATKIKNLVEAEQKMLAEYQSSNSVVELQNAVNWAKTYPVKTVPIMRELSALLPERGFITSFHYNEDGDVELKVQFDTSREAAYYLKSLLDSEWIDDARLNELSMITLGSTDDSDETAENDEIQRYTGTFAVTLNQEKILKDENEKDETKDQEVGETTS
jgi:type IV pilus assembly protein PilN